MQIWPAIDLRGGKCVRLEQGDYSRETVFGDDPAEVARRWVSAGADCLHLVDLDGAREGQSVNRDAVAAILNAVKVPCQLGGGVRDEASIRAFLDLGLARVVIGTRAVRDPLWFGTMCRRYPQRMVLGIDARDGLVATDGWQQTSHITARELAGQLAAEPIAAIVYTDIARDGMMAGPNFVAMRELNESVQLPVIASGGVTSVEDVHGLVQIGLAGCIIGRALYEGKLELDDAIRAAHQTE